MTSPILSGSRHLADVNACDLWTDQAIVAHGQSEEPRMISDSKQEQVYKRRIAAESESPEALNTTIMSETAEQLTNQLRKGLGNLPQWKTETTRECLDNGDTQWSITIKYHKMAYEYHKLRLLARTVHRMCKKQIGKHPSITEGMIKKWLAEDDWTDAQVRTEYQRQFDEAQLKKRNAKKLLCEMRRNYGDCHLVVDTHVRKWMKQGLGEGEIKRKYQQCIGEAPLANRAAALRCRLKDEVPGNFVVSDVELLKKCRDNPDDNAIVDAYWFEFAAAEEEAKGEDGVQEETLQEN